MDAVAVAGDWPFLCFPSRWYLRRINRRMTNAAPADAKHSCVSMLLVGDDAGARAGTHWVWFAIASALTLLNALVIGVDPNKLTIAGIAVRKEVVNRLSRLFKAWSMSTSRLPCEMARNDSACRDLTESISSPISVCTECHVTQGEPAGPCHANTITDTTKREIKAM